MSELRLRLTLWFLRSFQPFRSLERRVEQLTAHESVDIRLSRASAARVEAEVLYALIVHTPIWVDCDVLPTERVGWLGHGQIKARIFEGGGPK